ncbi:MAG: glycosyl transferase family 2 [Deltaproteobacteria bacterium]|nr:MAG: glycosyl transferase family 2 [Deltaproteobacteria bacterium]
MNPIISVIIPCYNSERFLRQTLDSVLQQTYTDWEIIAVNDGSTDGTQDLLDEYRERSPEQIRFYVTENQGVSAARDLGTTHARGKYLQYLDSDDLLLPDSLSRKVAVLEETGADVVYCNWQRLDVDVEGEKVCRSIEDVNPDLEAAILADFWCPPVCLLYRRSVYDQVGGWSSHLKTCEDSWFMMNAAFNQARFVHIPEVLAQYREYPESLSKRDRAAFTKDHFQHVSETEDRWREHDSLTEVRKQALLKAYFWEATYFYDVERDFFEKIYNRIKHLEPHFVPPSTVKMRVMSFLFGYRRAEAIASWQRAFLK